MNQELIEYIKSQLSAGIAENDIKNILAENGWANEDIQSAFTQLKVLEEETNNGNFEVPVEAALTTKYDLGMPSETKADSLKETEIKSPVATEVTVQKKNRIKNLVKAAIIFVCIVAFGGFAWVGAKYLSSWISQKNPELNKPLLSPETPGINISPPEEIDKQATDEGLLQPTPYISQKSGFEMSVPINWTVDESGSFGTLLSMSNTEPDVDGENKFIANINVVSEKAEGTSLEEYLSASKEVLNKSFTDYQLINETKVDLKGIPGILLEARYNMGVYPLHNLQMMLISNDTAYVITATSLESTWSKYQDVFNASLTSFTLR